MTSTSLQIMFVLGMIFAFSMIEVFEIFGTKPAVKVEVSVWIYVIICIISFILAIIILNRRK